MTAPVTLIPLRCLRCETSVPAQPEEVAWRCSQCGQGLLLDESKGLVPLEIHYSADIPPNGVGKPFWVAEGQVTVSGIRTAGISQLMRNAFGVEGGFHPPGFRWNPG